jgi:uncharacterized damage-inducible protein DinB
MKNRLAVYLIFGVTLLVLTATVGAQAPQPTPAPAPVDPLSAGLKGYNAYVADLLIRSAEKMPEENYSFKPVPEVRSFGQIIGHVADAQYMFASMVMGEPNPRPEIEKNKTTKADLVQALKDALAYSSKAYDSMTDAKGAEMIQFFGRNMPKLTVLTMNTAHNMEHYGNLVTYMRIKGLVPPSSERRQ